MHTSVSQAATALAASPLASRHSCARGVVAPAVAARRTRCAAPCRASMGAFAAAAPSDGGATTAWVVGQAVAATAILGAYFVFTQPASSQSRVDAEESACPVCQGSGTEACACTRWSADGEGCATCRGTSRSPCHACRGGGHRRPLLARLPVQDRPPNPPL